jgi:hypothetical protein
MAFHPFGTHQPSGPSSFGFLPKRMRFTLSDGSPYVPSLSHEKIQMETESGKTLKLYPSPEGIVTIICPTCNLSRRVDRKFIKRASEGFSVRCRCGEIFKARVEFRKNYRKEVKLGGIYQNLRSGRQGQMAVEDLSLTGVGFRTLGHHDLMVGDSVEVKFILDDKKKSKISLVVEVKRIQDQRVGAEIKQEARGNRDLGFYLMG